MWHYSLCAALLFLTPLAGESNAKPGSEHGVAAANGDAGAKPAAASSAASGAQDSTLNQAAARRNENVQVNLIDNDATKESNVRLGDNVTLLPQAPVEVSAYASEHGRAVSEGIAPAPAAAFSGFHAEAFEILQNSVFNARTFFQVGSVKPSRQNNYGGRATGNIRGLGAFTVSLSQRKVRGMVNGNVLVPLATERTPRTTDPLKRAFVLRVINAYPAELPNRTDLDSRLLNTNAPQNIDQIDGTARLDREFSTKDRFSAAYTLGRQRIDAFQLVAGMNPDTDLHNHRVRLGWTHAFSADTIARFGGAFTRNMSDLHADPTAIGPIVKTANQLQDLLPDVQFPIHRATNTYRYGVVFSKRGAGGVHTLTWGGDFSRYQMNGVESSNSRGSIWFHNDATHSAVENMLLGNPDQYEITTGPLNRGFRNVEANAFVADQWKLGSRLQIYYGLRYNLVSTPVEVNGLNQLPYGCDCNNFSPRFSIAWRGPGGWTVRTGYTVSFGQVFQVTYGQVRFNPPLVHRLQVMGPDLDSILLGMNANDPNSRQAPTVYSPDLVSPYSHQYNFSLERSLGGRTAPILRLAYIGSRTFKLLDNYIGNRAVTVPGMVSTTANVDQRRPDQRYTDVRWVLNAGAAYLDAAQVNLQAQRWRGLLWTLTYTFGKALDSGADYASTAANNDMTKFRPQTYLNSLNDRKALSNFDSTHSMVANWSYTLPRFAASHAMRRLLGDWQVTGAALYRTGTPFAVQSGSDAPGIGNVDGNSGDRPNILDTSILGATVGNPDTAPLILSRNKFSYLQPGQLAGNIGRNTFRKGGIANWNASLGRQFHLSGASERAMVLRAEVFNLTNHPQFDAPKFDLTNSSFGRITNTLNDGRVVQLSIRLQL